MKLTILGSGTVVPDGERNSSGYFVEAAGARVMLDCGAGTVHALARYGVDWQQMTHLFISHFHLDHVGELAALFFAFRHGMKTERTEPLTLIAPRGIDRVMHHLKEAFGEKLFTPKFPFDLITIEPGETVRLNDDCTMSVANPPIRMKVSLSKSQAAIVRFATQATQAQAKSLRDFSTKRTC